MFNDKHHASCLHSAFGCCRGIGFLISAVRVRVCVLIGGDLPAGSPLGLVGVCKNFIPGIWDSLKIVKVYLAVQE